MVMSLRLCLRRPNAGCMTWFSPYGENYAHTRAFTGSMNRKGLIEQKRIRDTDQGGTGLDHYDDNSNVMIVEIQWVEREVFY